MAAGNLIGDYEILGSLGSGGMGSVFKVRHVISQRLEALKTIMPERSDDAASTDRFLREIRVHASLHHPNITALHNAFRFHDKLVMVTELIDGVSLKQMLESPGITLSQARDYVLQVLSALGYAHASGVIHRDIKPSNVMVTNTGVVKLLDFGLARSGQDLGLTQAGTLLGSLPYLSPEQALGNEADGRSDLYSTGVLLYEMATGTLPFTTHKRYELIASHVSATPIPPNQINASIGTKLSKAILKALEKEPHQRFQTAEEFRDAVAATDFTNSDDVTQTAYRGAAGREGSKISDSDIDETAHTLAAFIGPIARIVVRRAAGKCHTLRDLYDAASREIDSTPDRERFLAIVHKRGVTRSASGTPSAS